MKKTTTILLLFILLLSVSGFPKSKEIKLIIRGDDIGSAHAANIACIKSYTDGIMRSVEIMVPCPWFEEAVKMLNENPGLDVGVHLTLTSEWSNIKWGPVSCAPSLVSKEGYFFPFIWKNGNYPLNNSLLEADWKLEDVEKEFRAQLELAKSKVPNISHLSGHMGCSHASPEVAELTKKLAKEYDLDIDTEEYGVQYTGNYNKNEAEIINDKIDNFIAMLNKLEPGIWLFVEHPSLNVPEMQGFGHIGYENVGKDRQDVTDIFTSPKVKNAIEQHGIKLISYADLEKEQKIK